MTDQPVDDMLRKAVRGVDAAAVTGVNTGPLDVLHDTRNQHIFAVGYLSLIHI